jgi:hypothetical protein
MENATPKKSEPREYTAERIATWSIDQLKSLRDNAVRLGNDAVADLCNEAIAGRTKASRAKAISKPRSDEVVVGFHFVCPGQAGVTSNGDGTAWTGTWVVDTEHAERGAKIGAYVALHTSKSEASYLQGTLKDWRRARRERDAEDPPAKIETGIDFLIEVTAEPYRWCGDGAGEKGYAWGKPHQA